MEIPLKDVGDSVTVHSMVMLTFVFEILPTVFVLTKMFKTNTMSTGGQSQT